jgi:MgsA AAA+ ATPase C terminal
MNKEVHMIDRKDVLASFRLELVKPLSAHTPPPLAPMPTTVWIAASVMQKATRRGEEAWALSAAATLLIENPDKLWRRLACIAVEDVGLADICAVGGMVGMMSGKRMRASLGGEWPVASWLVQRLAQARKSRATDDLLMTAQLLPSLEAERDRLAELSNQHLRLILLGTDSLHVRALALLYLAGTAGKPVAYLKPRRGEPALAFDVLDELGTPFTVLELAREGHRVSREPLWLLMALLAAEQPDLGREQKMDDELPTEIMAGPAPSWAIDSFTREGKLAINRFLNGVSPYSEWLQAHVPRSQHRTVTARALFHVEGGLLRRRCLSVLNDDLRATNELQCVGLPAELAGEAMKRLHDDLPILNAIRAQIILGQTHA